jgi:hypothetical protein
VLGTFARAAVGHLSTPRKAAAAPVPVASRAAAVWEGALLVGAPLMLVVLRV